MHDANLVYETGNGKNKLTLFESFINVFNIDDYYEISYKVDYPLTLLFNDGTEDNNLVHFNLNYHSMIDYNKVFFFLLKLKGISELLKFLWEHTNSSENRRSSNEVYNKMRKFQLLRSRMHFFVNNITQ